MFLNSLAFQKRLFDFHPDGPITVLLADFSDAGNAGATVVPYNAVISQISPFSFAFETIAGNDRMNIIMNHELVHVATMDQAARSDRFFRRLFGGKVSPVHQQPESIAYFFLTTPRVAAPRWYHEGIAVFVDTWMAGGLGRAQGGYDEMVFRSMVRDGTPFYDPLGLVSEGTRIDFQVEVDSYLYGTRFMTWLARRYSPEKLIEWVSRHDGSRSYYSSQFSHVLGTPLEEAWSAWVKDETTFQRNLALSARICDIATSSRTRWGRSRALTTIRPTAGSMAFNYPALSHAGAIDTEVDGGDHRETATSGPSIHTVTGLATIRRSHDFLYRRQQRLLRLDGRRHRDPPHPHVDEGRLHRRSRSTEPTDRSGVSAT